MSIFRQNSPLFRATKHKINSLLGVKEVVERLP